MKSIDFSDKLVAVTGAASGIGKAAAIAFAGYGAKVAAIDVNDSLGSAIAKDHAGIEFFNADVSSPQAVHAAHDAILAQYGRPVDILVSNAGVEDNRSGNLLTMPEAVLRRILEINLYGAINCARVFVPAMPNGSKVVFVSSLQAFMVSLPGTSYQASKAGIVGLAKALAVELGPRHINVNVVCPGGVATEGMGAARAGSTGLDDFRRRNPWGRRGWPDEIAYPILFLCSEWATYMTGQAMVVDGGMSVMASLRAEPPERWPDDPDV